MKLPPSKFEIMGYVYREASLSYMEWRSFSHPETDWGASGLVATELYTSPLEAYNQAQFFPLKVKELAQKLKQAVMLEPNCEHVPCSTRLKAQCQGVCQWERGYRCVPNRFCGYLSKWRVKKKVKVKGRVLKKGVVGCLNRRQHCVWSRGLCKGRSMLIL